MKQPVTTGVWVRRFLLAPVCLVSPVLLARALWHHRPNVWTAGVFALVLADWWMGWFAHGKPIWPGVLFVLGSAANLAVILRNNGRMPVVGKKEPGIGSVWVRAQSHHRWLVLADRTKWVGFSLGDVVIAAGLLLWFVIE